MQVPRDSSWYTCRAKTQLWTLSGLPCRTVTNLSTTGGIGMTYNPTFVCSEAYSCPRMANDRLIHLYTTASSPPCFLAAQVRGRA